MRAEKGERKMKREELEVKDFLTHPLCEVKEHYYLKADADSVMDAMEERIKELEASQPKWISVEDRLPNDSEPIGTWYIVKFTDGTHYFADWDSDIHIFTNPRCEYTSMVNNIVAWCKQPPKSED